MARVRTASVPDPALREKKAIIEDAVKKTQEAHASAAQAAQASQLEEKKKTEEPEPHDLDDLDAYMSYSDTAIDNPHARREVEARCEPLDFASIILNDEITQNVSIVPGVLEVRFRTILYRAQPAVTEAATERAKKEIGDRKGSDDPLDDALSGRRIQSAISDYNLAAHLAAVNDNVFPSLMNGRELNLEGLEGTVEFVRDRSGVVLEHLVCNLRWFLDRVARASRQGGLEESLGKS